MCNVLTQVTASLEHFRHGGYVQLNLALGIDNGKVGRGVIDERFEETPWIVEERVISTPSNTESFVCPVVFIVLFDLWFESHGQLGCLLLALRKILLLTLPPISDAKGCVSIRDMQTVRTDPGYRRLMRCKRKCGN